MARKKHKLHPFLKYGIAAAAVFTIFQAGSLHFQVQDLRKESQELDKQIEKQTKTNEDVHNSYTDGTGTESLSDEAIAQIARDVLGYASPGERVFIDSSEQ